MTNSSIDYSQEIWKPVSEYIGIYEASNFGRVRSLDRISVNRQGKVRSLLGRVLSAAPENNGYLTVRLTKNGIQKTKKVHRIVMAAFFGESPLCVDHKNGDKNDNALENLEYVTQRVNIMRGKLARKQYYNIYKIKRVGGFCWCVSITIRRRATIFGYYSNIDDAVKRRDQVFLELGILVK